MIAHIINHIKNEMASIMEIAILDYYWKMSEEALDMLCLNYGILNDYTYYLETQMRMTMGEIQDRVQLEMIKYDDLINEETAIYLIYKERILN